MPHAHPVRLASVMVLSALLSVLTACTAAGSDEDDEPPSVAAAIATPEAAPRSAAAKRGEDPPVASLSTLGSGVSADAAATYRQSLGRLRPAFRRFTVDYAHAMERMDGDAVLAAAASLRRAVVTFDAGVRDLDLAASQGRLDAVLALNDDFVETLGAVATATSGAQAVRIMEMLPFRDYLLAFGAVAAAL